ncbi:MAG TPA: hypothetical protein VNO17_07205 [Actinomycetota bacterium]|nr:hypothetical protein [Actinomycetota bacterium]
MSEEIRVRTEGRSAEEIRVRTEENELTLVEMSEALPDTATIMTRVADCWWSLIYAARAGNWPLADYYLRRVRKLENTLAVLRPKHAERLRRFQREALPDVVAALEAEDLDGLERAYAAATDLANELHAEAGYPYIRWELPDEPPRGLVLAPTDPPQGSSAT